MKKIIISLATLLMMCGTISAQTTRTNFFDGWHLGVVGDLSVYQKMNIVPLNRNITNPYSKAGIGGNIGIEASYNFAKYFGVSVGVFYGDVIGARIFEPMSDNSYRKGANFHYRDLQFPVKFEFHNRLGNSNFAYYSSIGLNFYNIVTPDFRSGHQGDYMYFDVRDYSSPRLKVDLQLNVGFYYHLKYNDLLRFGIKSNVAFKNKFEGTYDIYNTYPITTDGTMSYKNLHLGIEVGYIHCFKTKAEKRVR